MNHFKCMLFLICQSALFFSLHAQKPPSPDQATQSQLDAFRADYIRMFELGKAGILSPYLHADIRLMTVFQPTMMGPIAAEAYFSALFDRFDIADYSRTAIENWDLGTAVIEVGHFNLVLTNEEQSYALKGKYIDIWKKDASGLSLLTQAWNYDHGVDFWAELQFPSVPAVRIALEPHLPVSDPLSFELAAYGALLENTIEEGDAGLWSHYFADDAIRLGNFSPLYRGRTELDAYLSQHVAELPIFEKLDVRTDKIEALSDGYVLQYASHIANWRRDDQSGISTGKGLRVWQRQPHGGLKMILTISAYD